MNMLKNGLLIVGLLLMPATPWAAEVTPPVNLVGRPVPQIDSLPEGPYRALVVQGHDRLRTSGTTLPLIWGGDVAMHSISAIGPIAFPMRCPAAGRWV